ncbi:MAG: DoxX family protein [Acidobacteriota bacterium]|nr:DoxX family protein [Acidobacteriota bacterium]
MSIFEPAPSPWPGRMLAIFRIVAAAVFITSGTMKMFGWPPSPVQMPPFTIASQMGIGAILEVFGGLLILVGFLTRPVAFILAGEMAVAYFQFHYPNSLFPTVNQGIPAILYCFLFLYLMVAGAGVWSIDAMIAGRRSRT